jgi:hypothetical protein
MKTYPAAGTDAVRSLVSGQTASQSLFECEDAELTLGDPCNSFVRTHVPLPR